LREIHSGSDRSAIDAVAEMLTIGEEIESLLLAHSGLFVTFPPPPTYAELMTYTRMLRIAWRRGEDQSPNEHVRFPYQFTQDIESAVAQIRRQLSELNATS